MKINLENINIDLNERLKEANACIISPFIYKNNKSKLKLKCNIDEHEWEVTYYCFVKIKNGCPRCAGQIIYEEEAKENVNRRLKEINAFLNEPFKYNGSKTRLKLKCNIDDYEWETNYSNFVNSKTGCPKCNKKVLFKEEIENNINKRLKEINASLIENYEHINNSSKLKLKCNIDGHEWETKYSNFINNEKGCAKCAKVLKLTQEEAEEKVKDQCKKMHCFLENSFVYSKSSDTILNLKCDVCNYSWNVTYNNFISKKSGCPSCNDSKGEKIIKEVLNKRNIKYEEQKKFETCKFVDCLPFDFYLPEYNTCIEYDGIQHFKPLNFFGGEIKFKNRIKKDKIKNKYCDNNNIRLIRISYKKFKDIENILEEKIKINCGL